MVSNVSLKKMIRAFAVCAAFIPTFVPAETLPTNPTKAEGDVRAASSYRTVRHFLPMALNFLPIYRILGYVRVNKKLKGD